MKHLSLFAVCVWCVCVCVCSMILLPSCAKEDTTTNAPTLLQQQSLSTATENAPVSYSEHIPDEPPVAERDGRFENCTCFYSVTDVQNIANSTLRSWSLISIDPNTLVDETITGRVILNGATGQYEPRYIDGSTTAQGLPLPSPYRQLVSPSYGTLMFYLMSDADDVSDIPATYTIKANVKCYHADGTFATSTNHTFQWNQATSYGGVSGFYTAAFWKHFDCVYHTQKN
ncbi:MAG: hypothetical protein R2795_04740 [Saprospiraceae bacterium]